MKKEIEDIRTYLSKEDEEKLKEVIVAYKYDSNWGRVINSFTFKELLHLILEDYVKRGLIIKSEGKYREPNRLRKKE